MDEFHETGASARQTESQNTEVRVEPASAILKAALRQLLTIYLDELAVAEGVPPRPRDADGHAAYRWFDDYWVDASRTPLAIWVGDDLAGFCLLRDADTHWQVSEFFVAPCHRRRGIGSTAVTAIKHFCRAGGKHAHLEASTLSWNEPALCFWRSQGFETVSETPERLSNVFHLSP